MISSLIIHYFARIVLSVSLLWEFAWNILFKPSQRIPPLSRGKCNTPVLHTHPLVTQIYFHCSSIYSSTYILFLLFLLPPHIPQIPRYSSYFFPLYLFSYHFPPIQIFSPPNIFSPNISLLRCNGDEWSCRGGENTQCVPLSWVCDNRSLEFGWWSWWWPDCGVVGW